MVEFPFHEPIYILSCQEPPYEWKEYNSFHFYYAPFESSLIHTNSSFFQKNQKDDCKLKITGRPNAENSIFRIKLNHFFEFHHYTRKEFLGDYQGLRKTPAAKRTPNNILEISINHDYIGRNRYFYAQSESKAQLQQPYLIGCDFNRKESRNQWQRVIEKLYLEFRYSKNHGLLNQLHIRFTEIMIESFKDIARFLWKIHTNNEKTRFCPSFLHLLRKFHEENLKIESFQAKVADLRTEFRSIVYKCMISEGVLPIYVDLNTMWSKVIRWCNIFCCGFCLNDEVLPWSPQFHASFIVIDRYYSYTEKNRVHQKLLKDRIYSQTSDYYRIKLLDFFPLDQWVLLISDFLFEKFDEFVGKLAELNQGISHIYERTSEFYRKQTPMKSYQCQETGSKEPFLEKTEREARKKTSSDLDKLYFVFKNEKKSIKQPIFTVLIEAFNNSENEIPKLLAESFISTYFSELENTKILENLCKLLAETEMRTYSLLNLNCQTVVGDFVQSIYQTMKNYIEILFPSNINILNYKNDTDYENHFQKFASQIVNKEFVTPCYLDTRLDYFGIYADRFLKEKIDKLISGPNIDCQDDVDISKAQKEFFDSFRASFQQFKTKLAVLNKSLNENSLFDKKNKGSPFPMYLEEEKSSNMPLHDSSINNPDNENETLNKKQEEKGNSFQENDKKMSEIHKKEEENNKKQRNKLGLEDCLSSLIFKVTINLIEVRKRLRGYKYKKWEKKELTHLAELNKKKYENRDLLREFSYYYYNSIRLQQAKNDKKGVLSYIGHVIIKDPEVEIDDKILVPNIL